VGTGLKSVNATYRKNRKRQLENLRLQQLREAEDAKVRQRIKDGTWHDARLDCIAGNGVMSELGFGDEEMGEKDIDAPRSVGVKMTETGEEKSGDEEERKSEEKSKKAEDTKKKQMSEEDLQAIEAMPIVILKGFEAKGGNPRREELLTSLASWAAGLAENQVAHVIVVSDNRENAKQLARGKCLLDYLVVLDLIGLRWVNSTAFKTPQLSCTFRRRL
jgi:hypothetical protein